jgi:hypothetical protein
METTATAQPCWLCSSFWGLTARLGTTAGGARWARPKVSDKQGLLQVNCALAGQCVAPGAPTETLPTPLLRWSTASQYGLEQRQNVQGARRARGGWPNFGQATGRHRLWQ